MSVIIITGVTSGFGRATAELFIAAGWKVAGSGRRADRMAALASLWGDAFLPLNFDVRDKAAVFASLSSLPAPFSAPDALVNNAGLALGLECAPDASLEDWETMIDTNIKGMLYCTQAVLPGMVERKSGHIVNLGSIAGTFPYPGGNTYGASKAFVLQFSQNLRTDLHGKNIRVTNIEPGLAESEFSLVRFKGDAARSDAVYQGCQPLTPADIAETIRWAVTLPPHVNINRIEVMPTCQSPAALRVAKS